MMVSVAEDIVEISSKVNLLMLVSILAPTRLMADKLSWTTVAHTPISTSKAQNSKSHKLTWATKATLLQMLLQDLVQQEETLKRRSQQRKLTVQVQVLNLLQPRISMDTIKVK